MKILKALFPFVVINALIIVWCFYDKTMMDLVIKVMHIFCIVTLSLSLLFILTVLFFYFRASVDTIGKKKE